MPPQERKNIGQAANQVKQELLARVNQAKSKFGSPGSGGKSQLDVTLPGVPLPKGHLHPLTLLKREVSQAFRSMGFAIYEGPDVDNEYYAFESLNIPATHPARDIWDTFWVKNGNRDKEKSGRWLLRPHTSSMQVRIMEKNEPPVRAVVIGRCFRHEATDASHEHTFYQVEGFAVDEAISIANLTSTLKSLLSSLFQQKVKVRLRPSYFPFVEPGFELDFGCLNCQGKGCSVCSRTGWVELLGCGMIHPRVLEYAGYPKGKYTGFAFGLGLDRLAMMKHRIGDIRLFHSGDLRFLNQF